VSLPAVAGGGIGDVPEPENGAWADATLALLRHNRGLCDRIADDLLAYWRGLPADHGPQLERNEKAVRDYVLRQRLADLAAARASADLVRRFFPGTLAEVSSEAGAAMGRLFELQGNLCDSVAYPTGPRQRFADEIGETLARIDAEVTELGRLLVVPDEDLERALEPYLLAIELAGVEAQGELLAYLESLKPKPKGPTLEERMRGWYQRYGQAVQPSKEALGRFLTARQNGDRSALGLACRELSRRTIEVLAREPSVFRAPEPSVEAPLRGAFQSLRRMATACTAGNFKSVDENLAEAQRRLAVAAQRLQPFGLSP